jgi:outer membrane receptor protein involved in Fe transport
MRFSLGTALVVGVLVAPVAPRALAQPNEGGAVGGVIATTGKLFDVKTGAPVTKATIAIEGSDQPIRPAEDGTFTIPSVALGATLVITADGYEVSLVTVDGTTLPDIPMIPLGGAGETIEITGDAPATAAGAAVLERDEIAHIPGTGNDLLAGLDAMPGVAASPIGGPTSFNGVVIRGSSPEDSKVLIDGFEVPFLYHTVGFRSILPTESIESLEYLPGGFDVAYGRASSGIVSVKTRPGTRKYAGQAEVSVIDGGVMAQGAAGKRGTFLVAFRRSTVDLILPSLIPDDADINLATLPRYYDMQARYDYDAGKWNLSAALIGSDDVLQLFIDDEEDVDQRFYARTRFLRAVGTARWADGPWAATFALSPSLNQIIFEVGRNQYFDMVETSGSARAEIVHTKDAMGLKGLVTRIGAEAVISRADIDLALPNAPDEGQPMEEYDPDDVTNLFKGTIWNPDVAGWVAAAADLSPRARLSTGIRVDGFIRSGSVAVQPRGELLVKLPKTFKARLAVGAYRRPAENNDENLNDDLAPEQATQVILGLEHGPTRGLKIQTSGYFTDRRRLLTRGDDGEYHNVGTGRTIGAEVLAILRSGPWFGWLSYSISKSTRIDRPGAEERLFDFDQTHDLNVALSWKSKKWQLGGRFKYTSGQPYTPVAGSVFDSDRDLYVPIYGDVNSERVAAHHQIDIRVDRMWNWGRIKMSAFLDVQNVYLNTSVAGYGYSFDYSERFAFESLPIIPSIGLRGEL